MQVYHKSVATAYITPVWLFPSAFRAYNYKDDRVSEHRIGQNFPLKKVLEGEMADVVNALTGYDQKMQLEELAESLS